jgi:hypothetical protein
VILSDEAVMDIVQAEQISDYKLKLYFSDGTERVRDFEPFLRRSRNPMICAYLGRETFASIRLEYGDLVWNDYGLCFSTANLNESRI